MTLEFNSLEVSFYYDFNPMVMKNWMSIKSGLVIIHRKSGYNYQNILGPKEWPYANAISQFN